MATSTLPLYKRYINGVPLPNNSRKTLRLREKYILFIILVLFGFVCFIGTFFLPELRGSRGLNKAYHGLKKTGENVFLPNPESVDKPENGYDIIQHGRHKNLVLDPHLVGDKAKLLRKVVENMKPNNVMRDQVEEPQVKTERQPDKSVQKPVPSQIKTPLNQISPDSKEKLSEEETLNRNVFGLHKGDPFDEENRYRQKFIKGMMKHAWDGYVRYAWGKNELRPISKTGHSPSIFGSGDFGATIVDSLDTLYLMGLQDEFNQGRDWVASELDLNKFSTEISVFETNIRYIGGLLSCYALTKQEIFKTRAEEIAKKLLPAFNTPTNIPNALVHTKTGSSRNFAWAAGGSSILSEFGTLHLEFMYLSNITSNPIYQEKVMKIRKILKNLEKINGGLYPNYLNPKTGKWGLNHVSVGALGDSFYEYLLKAYIQSNKTDSEALEMFVSAMKAIEDNMMHRSRNGLLYIAEFKSQRQEHKMGHLACFIGGLYALGAETIPAEYNLRSHYLSISKNITQTCHESYDRTATKIGPETFWLSDGNEGKAIKSSEKYYIQRPEVIESYYVLWRLTKDPKYRQWGWEAAQAIEKHCRVESGYTGLKNVYSVDSPKDDVQQSFFLAETLKYLYLLFSSHDLLPIDKWVLNTEAHPLPIQ